MGATGTKTDDRERLFRDWQALREACNVYHRTNSKGPGGAVMCVCGRGCGGSSACSMLGRIQSLVRYLPTESLPKEWRDHIELLRSVI